MIKIGITGGIGSGKSVVCELLRLHGIPVYDADAEAKRLNDISPVIREKLSAYFGKDLYTGDRLDKKKFAQLIFNDPEKLRLANSVIHPELMNNFVCWAHARKNFPVVALDAAVLLEGNFGGYVDKIVTVYAPENIRFERASQRDGVSQDKIKERAKNQLPDEKKMAMSDFVILNDGKHSLISQVSWLLNNL